MDIRSFFAPKGGAKAAPKEKEAEKKKRPAVISDSDSEGDSPAPVKKATKPSPKPKKEPKAELPKPKLKEIKATDFFASNTKEAKSSSVTPSKKRKEAVEERDAAFSQTLKETEFPQQTLKKQRTESPEVKPSLASKLAAQVIERSLVTD